MTTLSTRPQKRKRTGLIWASASLITLTALVICGCGMTRASYETAPYKVTAKPSSGIEVRSYPTLVLASTRIPASTDGNGSGFMTLFGYISGENESGKKIPMTTPVFMNDGDDGAEMSFVMPQDVAANAAPTGLDPSVTLKRMLRGEYAVYRIKGPRSDDSIRSAEQTLSNWIESTRYRAAGPFIVAGYDPPFTPGMFQRNEVLIRVETQ